MMRFLSSIGIWLHFLSAAQQVCDAWIPLTSPFSLSSLASPPLLPINQKRKLGTTMTTKRDSLLVLSSGGDRGLIFDFVKSLDSAIGNPTQSTDTSAVINGAGNEIVLIGGVLASLTIAGLALTILTTKNRPQDEEEENVTESPTIYTTSQEQETSTVIIGSGTSDTSDTDTDIGRSDSDSDSDSDSSVATIDGNTDMAPQLLDSEEEQISKQKVKEEKVQETEMRTDEEKDDDVVVVDDKRRQSILAKLRSTLKFKTKELETSQDLLKKEKKTRIDVMSKLLLSTKAQREITEKYETTQQNLFETTENLTFVETQLQLETQQRDKVETELSAAIELNRIVEDQYELEQNSNSKVAKELDTTKDSLLMTQKQLQKKCKDVIAVKAEVINTNRELTATSASLDQLQDEQRSVRTLGKKMWKLSKSRITNRISKVFNRKKKK
mmetsp:Transcript_18219/g.21053  ORF Transcript_18219/g.21053 Transcript_18219/m.21053 type:complete len:440 (+) Transcript_18219:159-1478(+)